jgi:hypothetical protein
MRRAALMLALATVFVVTPLTVGGHQANKVWRIGHLTIGTRAPGPVFGAFLERLRELGYVEG